MIDPYAILGVERDASEADIKRAYRRRIAAAHPDRFAGASEEDKARAAMEAAQINEAYAILSDLEAKKRYDETGTASAPKGPRQMAEQGVLVLLNAIVNDDQEFEGDIVSFLKSRVNDNSSAIRQGIDNQERRIKRLNRLKSRLSGPMIEDIINGQLASSEGIIKRNQEQLETDKLVLELLGEYKDSWKPERRESSSPFAISFQAQMKALQNKAGGSAD